MSDTSAPLLANVVLAACHAVIVDINTQRRETMSKIVADVIKRVGRGGSPDVPPEEEIIVQLLRKDELDRMHKVIELCEAIADVPGIRLDVSLADFQIIKRYYIAMLKQVKS